MPRNLIRSAPPPRGAWGRLGLPGFGRHRGIGRDVNAPAGRI